MTNISLLEEIERAGRRDEQIRQIDAALAGHLATLHDAFFDLLAAVITLLLFVTTLTHSIIRMLYAVVGIVIWSLALWITVLQALQGKIVARSHTSPFRETYHA